MSFVASFRPSLRSILALVSLAGLVTLGPWACGERFKDGDGDGNGDGNGDGEQAQVQLIHNAASEDASTVDVFLNDSLLVDDFNFRTATDFRDVPADEELTIVLAGSDAADGEDDTTLDPGDTPLAEFTEVILEPDSTNVVVATGPSLEETGSSGSTGNASGGTRMQNGNGDMQSSVELKAFGEAKLNSSDDPDTDSFLAFHGSPDAPAVDVFANRSEEPSIEGLAPGMFSNGYLDLPAGISTLDLLTDTDTPTRVESWQTPELTGGGAFTVVASGFLDDERGPGFGLFAFPATTPEGQDVVDGIELPLAARAQIIHASPDPAVEMVDVYLNDERILDDVAFFNASPFLTLPSGTDLEVAFAGPESTNADNPLFETTLQLDEDATNVAIASGVTDPSQFEGTDNGFDVRVGDAREAAANGGVDVNLFHGSPDAAANLGGPVDLIARFPPSPQFASAPIGEAQPTERVLADDLAFGGFSGLQTLDPTPFALEVTDSDRSNVAAEIPVAIPPTLDGTALTLVVKGFVTTDDGQDPEEGEPFGLVGFAPDGERVDFPIEIASTN